MPRVFYRRTGARYPKCLRRGLCSDGVVVAAFGVVTVALYVDLSAVELLVFAACWAAGYAVEGRAAAVVLRRAARPARASSTAARMAPAQAWSAAARLPVVLLRRPGLYAIGAVGAGAAGLALAALLGLPARDAGPAVPRVLPAVSVLGHLALPRPRAGVCDRCWRRSASGWGAAPLDGARVSLHAPLLLLAAVPMVNWGAGLVVAGLLTDNPRDLDTLAPAGVTSRSRSRPRSRCG